MQLSLGNEVRFHHISIGCAKVTVSGMLDHLMGSDLYRVKHGQSFYPVKLNVINGYIRIDELIEEL